MTGDTTTTALSGQRVILRRLGRRLAVVVDYGLAGGIGRQGYWCEDRAGGWGTSRRSAEEAITQCVQPVTYPSRQCALEYY